MPIDQQKLARNVAIKLWVGGHGNADKLEQTILSTYAPAFAEMKGRIAQLIATIEKDAIACEKQAAESKAKKDGINEYLMSTQAMAHRLDIQRIKQILIPKEPNE